MNIFASFEHMIKMKDHNLLDIERDAQMVLFIDCYYEKMLNPFFEILDKNKILETI